MYGFGADQPVPLPSTAYDEAGRLQDDRHSDDLMEVTGSCWEGAVEDQASCVFNSGLVYANRLDKRVRAWQFGAIAALVGGFILGKVL